MIVRVIVAFWIGYSPIAWASMSYGDPWIAGVSGLVLGLVSLGVMEVLSRRIKTL